MEPSEVVKMLEGIGEMLSPYAERAWAIVLAQQSIVATQMWIGVGVCGLALLFSLYLIACGASKRQVWRASALASYLDDGSDAIIVGVIIAVLVLLVGVPLALSAWARGANPEYYAIMALKGIAQ